MASSNMPTFLCIGMVMLTIVFGNSEKCPSPQEIGCRSDTLPCTAPLSVPLQSELKLEDGTICPACTLCSASADTCPPVACPLIRLPEGCSRHKFYSLYITLEKSGMKCWACDYLKCLAEGE